MSTCQSCKTSFDGKGRLCPACEDAYLSDSRKELNFERAESQRSKYRALVPLAATAALVVLVGLTLLLPNADTIDLLTSSILIWLIGLGIALDAMNEIPPNEAEIEGWIAGLPRGERWSRAEDRPNLSPISLEALSLYGIAVLIFVAHWLIRGYPLYKVLFG